MNITNFINIEYYMSIIMITIPIGLDEELIKKIDRLVAQGRYKNRTEALRDQIISGLERISLVEEEPLDTEKHQEILKGLLSLSKPPNILKTEKTVSELVAAGREP